jgi:hypothetical protein
MQTSGREKTMRSVLVLTLLLGAIGCNKSSSDSSSSQPASSPSSATSEPGGASATPAAAPAEKKPEEWVRSEKTDQMDGHKSVFLTLRSTNRLRYGVDGEGPARITLSCEGHVFLMLEPGSNAQGLRYKFDESAPVQDNWGNDGRFLTTLILSDRLNQIMRAKTLKIEFSPPGSIKQIATFDLGNVRELIQQEKACNFRKKAAF